MEDELTEYYVCFIDLMGQTEFFKRISSEVVDDEVVKHIKRVSDGLREIIRYVKNRYASDFSPEDDVGLELFSDSVMLSVRARRGVHFSSWLDIIVKLVYIACRHQLPFRGGIALGTAVRSERGSLYGFAVDEAMRIEAIMADYPRVVISPSIVQDERVGDLFDCYATVDADSLVVLNYAGNGLLSGECFEQERRDRQNVCNWVRSCYESFCFTGDSNNDDAHANAKLARRYRRWLEYLLIEAEVRSHHV